MKITVNTYPFPNEDLKPLVSDFKDIEFSFVNNKKDLMVELEDSDAIITFNLKKSQLETAPKLKWIQAISAGVDFLPLDYIESRNIELTTGRGIHKIHMTEYALSMMILGARRFDKMIIGQNKKTWDHSIQQDEIYGKKLGIIGLGSIGMEIAKKASVLGMEVYGVKRTEDEIPGIEKVYTLRDLNILTSKCDYIINLLPHTDKTDKIIDEKIFNSMKKDSCMINMGRGGTVNEDHLYTSLSRKKFRLYISDVFETEPLPEDSKLWNLENMVITPHICGPNTNYLKKAYIIIKENIRHYINNEELMNKYSFKKGY
jgi:phosphoglycerate dehydrogenase-like enzyme